MRNLSNLHVTTCGIYQTYIMTCHKLATTFRINKTYINNIQNLSNLRFHAPTCGLGIYQIFIILYNNKILHQLY